MNKDTIKKFVEKSMHDLCQMPYEDQDRALASLMEMLVSKRKAISKHLKEQCDCLCESTGRLKSMIDQAFDA